MHPTPAEKCISRWKLILRKLLAVLTALITLGCIIATIVIVRNVGLVAGIDNLPANEVTNKSIDIQLELSKTLSEIALLMTGALWALIIAKKDESRIVFSEIWELIMFLSASVVLLLSLCSYGFYLNKMSNYFADASAAATKGGLPLSVPDIFNQNVYYLFVCQVVSLLAGVLNGVLTLVSVHRLKE